MDPNPEVYYMTVESAKKRNLIIDSVMFFLFFYFFFVIFSHFGPQGGLWGRRVTRGAPKAPVNEGPS